MNRTLVICKPDAVERGLSGEIIARLERKGLRLVAAELRTLEREVAAKHYAEHEGKGFYEDLLAFITRSPVMVMVVGALDTGENLVHGSDSAESAAREIGIFFPDLKG